MKVALAFLHRVLQRQNMIVGLVGVTLGSGLGSILFTLRSGQRP